MLFAGFFVVVFLQELGFYVLLVRWPFLTVSFQVVRRRCLTHSHKRCVQQDCLTLTHALCQTGLSHTFKNELCFSTARLHVLERQITNNNFAGMLPFIVDDYHSIPCCPPPSSIARHLHLNFLPVFERKSKVTEKFYLRNVDSAAISLVESL